ncbi:endoglucanase [Novosphingobium chloroacetimidivorans]|uniref:Endoglucanase n=1 Tax=Novosphingobium chloroacetimidivorans TaxID=1428314 RepID=A0A7W7NWB2_9SPHN|nr:cellulase family glycosylhydrolase [Novosphingobium chloroacetimidivorans]MBB4858244.1 endoglucanase [Novosphingobium chloroacetimidivorans]
MRTLLIVSLALAALPVSAKPLFGVNLSGLEASKGGRLGWSHIAPTREDIALAVKSGVKVARIPFKMDRVAPGGYLDPIEFGALRVTVATVRAAGIRPLIDDHSYGAQANPTALASAWANIARELPSDVILGLQNEPHKRGADWWPFAQSVVADLRAAGVQNWLSVAGSGYSPANTWDRAQGPHVLRFKDPLKRTYFEAHTYFDKWGSGTEAPCVPGSANRLNPVLRHAQANGYRVIIGELAFSADPSCDAVRSAAVAKIKESPAVYAVTFWTLGNFAMHPRYLFGLTGPGKGKPSVLLNKLVAEWKRF